MTTRRATIRVLALAALPPLGATDARGQAQGPFTAAQPDPARPLETTIRFSFEILNLVTNHQFEGQTNSFLITYEYAAPLQGGGFDPAGHAVPADNFPYFQTVRDDIVDFVRRYPERSDFYEIFADNIARHIMRRYPQFRWIDLTIRAPAFASVTFDRAVNVRVTRG